MNPPVASTDAKRSRGRSRTVGCLLGGAVGDALGAPVAPMKIQEIRRRHGEAGIAGFQTAYGRNGAVTQATQMALFTAEGLILSKVRQANALKDQAAIAVYHACLRWLYTQDAGRQAQLIQTHGTCAVIDGILTGYRELCVRRAPDPVCLAALRSGVMGTPTQPINAEKGCGGLTRAAPAGLACADAKQAFALGCACAAVTHGHPGGYLPGGFLAALLSKILAECTLRDAVAAASDILKRHAGHEECLQAVESALALSRSRQPQPETLQTLGSGQTAAQALAMALYCALAAGDDFRRGVLWAVNHSGKSDATGAIAGHILGACCGEGDIPETWLAELELKDVIVEIAGDLFDQVTDVNVS